MVCTHTRSNGLSTFSPSSSNNPSSSQFLRNRVGVGVWSIKINENTVSRLLHTRRTVTGTNIAIFITINHGCIKVELYVCLCKHHKKTQLFQRDSILKC